jgi:hypothetical protein
MKINTFFAGLASTLVVGGALGRLSHLKYFSEHFIAIAAFYLLLMLLGIKCFPSIRSKANALRSIYFLSAWLATYLSFNGTDPVKIGVAVSIYLGWLFAIIVFIWASGGRPIKSKTKQGLAASSLPILAFAIGIALELL